MAREGYNAVVGWSSKELTKIEKLMLTQSPDAVSLNDVTETAPIYIEVEYVAIVQVHNENNHGDKDYNSTYVMAKDGNLYKTSSQSFTTNIVDIVENLEDELEAGEPFPVIKVYQKASKTRSGQHFISCAPHVGPIPQAVPVAHAELEAVDPTEVPNFEN